MSGLDANPPSSPADGQENAAVALTPPAAVAAVPEDEAIDTVPIAQDRRDELRAKAESFVAELAKLEPGSPEFSRTITDITHLGEREVRASADVSNRMLHRPAWSLAGARARDGHADPQAQVAQTLRDLRKTITDLDPSRADATGPKRALVRIPGAAQQQLDTIIHALISGQDALLKDNAAIEHERAGLWATMGKLAQYSALAAALDGATAAHIATLRTTDPRRADALTADALFPIRQRRQDLTTQLAVSVQGYLALDVVRKNNAELITGVERARTTTVSALRTAVVVAQALEDQRLVLDQIAALNDTTRSMIDRTSDILKQQTGMIQDAASSGVSVDTLQHAFDDVFSTMDAIDAYRGKAAEAMAVTIDALEQQVARSRRYLDRSRNS